MLKRNVLVLIGIAIVGVAVVLASATPASAAPTPNDYNPDEIYNDTYNDFASALNITTNSSTRMLFYLDCGIPNDYDYMYVWLPAGRDLSISVETDQLINFRFEVALKSPEHFNLATHQLRPQPGFNIYQWWFNTTSWTEGNYYIAIEGPSCPTPANWYNVTYTTSVATGANDGDNSLTTATDVTSGPLLQGNLTETSDQADFFRVTSTFTPPTFQYLQLTVWSQDADFDFEFYNASGAVMTLPRLHSGMDPNNTAFFLNTQGFRFPAQGTYYMRLWTGSYSTGSNSLNEGNYTLGFTIAEFTPSSNIDFANATLMTDNFVRSNDALNYSFEQAHYFKIFIGSPRTIWVDAWSNQVDIQVQLTNETFSGAHSQRRLSRNFFDNLANPKDHENFSYYVSAAQLANATGWYYVVVKLDSDLPPNGLFTLNVWLNDAPVGTIQPASMLEDQQLIDFNARSLFTDLDCVLNASDADCNLAVTLLAGSELNLTYDFSRAPLVTVTPVQDWSGMECRDFRAADAKNLTANGTLCITVDPVNDPPHTISPPAQPVKNMTEDQTLTAVFVALWFADVDAGDTLTITYSGNDNIAVTYDSFQGMADFDPELDFWGSNNITFTACDTSNACVSWVTEFRVGPVNDPPEAVGALPSMTITEDGFGQMNLNAVMIYTQIGPAFTDKDSSSLSYRIYNSEPDLNVSVLGPVITVRPAQDAHGGYFFEVAAFDGFLESTRAFIQVTVTAVNDAPVITAQSPPNAVTTINEGESKTFTVTAGDPDGETPTYQWYVNAVGVTGETRFNFTYLTQVTDELNRSVTVKVVVSDALFATTETEWTLNIVNVNQAPRSVGITSPQANAPAVTTEQEITFSATGVDPDNDAMTFTWYSDKIEGTGLIGTGQTITAKLPAGPNAVKVSVNDGHGGVTQQTVTVQVRTPTPPPSGGAPILLIGAGVGIAVAAVAAVVLMRRKKQA